MVERTYRLDVANVEVFGDFPVVYGRHVTYDAISLRESLLGQKPSRGFRGPTVKQENQGLMAL